RFPATTEFLDVLENARLANIDAAPVRDGPKLLANRPPLPRRFQQRGSSAPPRKHSREILPPELPSLAIGRQAYLRTACHEWRSKTVGVSCRRLSLEMP